ncbi:MAG: hypothetical protein IKH06_06735 [Clostridiales bacterium]|nr:hypothetical protein [Clostridiales bacterium]
MKTCSNCGAQFPDNDFSCPNCGLPDFLSESVPTVVPEDIYSPEYLEYDQTEYPVYKKRRNRSSVYLVLSILVILATAGIALYCLLILPLQKYNAAVAAFDAGDYKTAAAGFEAVGDFRDSKERAAEAGKLIHYSNGKSAFGSGDFEKAKAEFIAAGTYKDSAALAEESEKAGHYAKALSLIASGDSDAAVEELKLSGDYKDSKKLIFDTLTGMADRALGTGEYEKAADYYVKAGEYGSVSDKEIYISYGYGVRAFKQGSYEQAADYFAKAGNYRDSASQKEACYSVLAEEAIAANDLENAARYYAKSGLKTNDASAKLKEICYSAGIEAFGKKDYGKAADYLKAAGNYKDAAQKCKQAFYLKGTMLVRTSDYSEAMECFRLAGDYKDSKELRKECRYCYGIEKLISKEFDKAASIFRQCGKYKFSKELIKVCKAEEYYEAGLLSDAVSTYSKISPKVAVKGFNVQARKDSVITEAVLSSLSGDWTAKSNDAYVMRTLKIGWKKKKSKYAQTSLIGGQDLWFESTRNVDGSFNITIQATYFRFLNYSKKQANVKTGIKAVKKSFFSVRKMPSSFKLAKNITVKYKKGVITLEYAYDSKKGKRTDTYRSTVKYRKR